MITVNPNFMTEPLPFRSVTPAGFRDVLETKVTANILTPGGATATDFEGWLSARGTRS